MSAPDVGHPRPLRILMVAATPYFADRGCHVRVQGEARALERRGARVTIVTYGLGRDVPGGRIRRTPALPGYRRLDAAPALGKLPLDALVLVRTLAEGERERPDLIHAHTQEGGLIGLVAGRALGVPVVVDLQSRRVAEELVHHGKSREGGLLYRIADGFDRWIPAAADAVVTSTRAIADYARAVAGASKPVEVLADAIDVPDPAPRRDGERARRLGLDPARPVVAYLGLLDGAQGVDLLLAAATLLHARRPEIQWLIMGYPGEAAWRERAAALGLGAVACFPGRIAFDDAGEFLALADLAVSAKRTTTEGNGKLLLYMSLGLPTLALDTATNREVLGPDGQYAPDDPHSFAEAVDAALAAPRAGAERGARLRERVRREASWDARAQQLLALYARLQAC